MPHTKIVCTIGPASREPEMLRRLIDAGMDVARLNFSHGDHALHAENISRIRSVARELNKPVAIMTDLQGPKLRVGEMAEGGVLIHSGEHILLTTRSATGHRTDAGDIKAVIPVMFKDLPQDVEPGDRILIDDGLLGVRVTSVKKDEITCEVVTGGVLRDHKGINLPGTGLSIPAITEKDWADLDFMIEQEVDWIALSFVRAADDVRRLQEHIKQRCDQEHMIRVIAKIEKPQALEHIDEIIQEADGIMVARGDLGIEIPAERVPLVQKRLIRLANAIGKPVITATQMLSSMVNNPRPTRAETSDVANAILDGTDAIMLSGETAVGEYPLEAVNTMVRLSMEIEKTTLSGPWEPPAHVPHGSGSVTDAVSFATCATADDLMAEAIIAPTASGTTARTIAKYRPQMPIIAVTPEPIVQRQLMLSWGVTALVSPRAEDTDRIVQNALHAARDSKLVESGARVIVTAGVTVNMPGTTNLMTVELVPEE